MFGNILRRFTTSKPKLTWYVPRWSDTRTMWVQFYHILNPGSLIRISVVAIVVSVAIIAGFKWAFPQLVLPNLWLLIFSLPAILLTLVFQFGVLTLFPPVFTIRADKILLQHGQSVRLIDPKSVTATCLIFHSDNRIRLRICYTKKSKGQSLVVGVPPTVDFNKLIEMLPIPPVVRDARSRSLTHQNSQSQA